MNLNVVLGLLCAALAVSCQPSSHVPPHTGIEFKLRSSARGEPELRPDGWFRVQGTDVQRPVYVPLTPFDPPSTAQRVALPPGSYHVSYVPIELERSLSSLRRRDKVQSSSPKAFVVLVSIGKFSAVNVRAVDASSTTSSREGLPLPPIQQSEPSLDATLSQRSPPAR